MLKSSFGQRLYAGLTSPWSIAFSAAGIGFGAYFIIESTQSGSAYELDEDLSGKTYIVTGATSGIGRATSEELAKRNARVIMACRSREKCIKVRRDIVLNTRNKQVFCRQCDLEDFESIKAFVSKVCDGKLALNRIDGVVNNAATMEPTREVNQDGIERTFVTNHLGPFLLTSLLLDKLFSQDNPVRVVFLATNVINRNCSLNLDDLNSEKREKWDGFNIYKESKLAQAMFAKELSKKVQGTNVSVNAADPGRTKSNLSDKLNANTFFVSRWLVKVVGVFMGERRVEKAVRPVLYALADKEMKDVNGVFLNRERKEQPWNEAILDENLREKLWLTSIKWSRLDEYLATLYNAPQLNTSATVDAVKEQKHSSWRIWPW